MKAVILVKESFTVTEIMNFPKGLFFLLVYPVHSSKDEYVTAKSTRDAYSKTCPILTLSFNYLPRPSTPSGDRVACLARPGPLAMRATACSPYSESYYVTARSRLIGCLESPAKRGAWPTRIVACSFPGPRTGEPG